MDVLGRVLLAIITSWVLSWVLTVQPFVASALSAESLQEIIVERGILGINDDTEDYDPWEPFNEKIFMLNCAADRYVLRPVAKAYNDLVLDGEKDAIHNMLDNVAMPKRFINSLLQGPSLYHWRQPCAAGVTAWAMSIPESHVETIR